MATRTQISSAKKRVELILEAQGKTYETWLYGIHRDYISKNDEVIQKALAYLAKDVKATEPSKEDKNRLGVEME